MKNGLLTNRTADQSASRAPGGSRLLTRAWAPPRPFSLGAQGSVIQRMVVVPGTQPLGHATLTEEETQHLDGFTDRVHGLVTQAHRELSDRNVGDWVGPHFENLRRIGAHLQTLPVEEQLEEDPRRQIGYAIEERAYSLMRRQADLGDWRAQHSTIFAGGTTYPDIVVPMKNGREALLDITASESAGHIYQKHGGGWFRSARVPYVRELTYPSFEPGASRDLAAAVHAGGMSDEAYEAYKATKAEEYKAAEEIRRRQAEAAFGLLNAKGLADFTKEHLQLELEEGKEPSTAAKHKALASLAWMARDNEEIRELGGEHADQIIGAKSRKQLSETAKREKARKRAILEGGRLRGKREDPAYREKEKALTAARKERERDLLMKTDPEYAIKLRKREEAAARRKAQRAERIASVRSADEEEAAPMAVETAAAAPGREGEDEEISQ